MPKNPFKGNKKPSQGGQPPPFEGPTSLTKQSKHSSTQQFVDDKSNAIVGECVDWQKQRAALVSKKLNSKQLDNLHDERERLIREAWKHARFLSHEERWELAATFIGHVNTALTVDKEDAPTNLRTLIDTWQMPEPNEPQRMQQLKRFRAKLAIASIVDTLSGPEHIGLSKHAIDAIAFQDGVEKCPVVRAHAERIALMTSRHEEYDLATLAKNDVQAVLESISAQAKYLANRKFVASEAQDIHMALMLDEIWIPASKEKELIEQKCYLEAGYLWLIKACIVVYAANGLDLFSTANDAKEKVKIFTDAQSWIGEVTVQYIANNAISQLEQDHPDAEFQPASLTSAYTQRSPDMSRPL